MAPIACSRMPKWKFRLPGVSASRSPPPSISDLFDGARSADPPISSSSTGARAAKTCPEAVRVAILGPPASKDGRASVQPTGSARSRRRRQLCARSGWPSAQESTTVCQPRWASAPRAPASRQRTATSGGTRKVSSSGHPYARLVARTSSAPSGAPWAAALSCLVGAPQAMWVRTRIRVGRPSSATAVSNAAPRASRSLPSSTSSTRQP